MATINTRYTDYMTVWGDHGSPVEEEVKVVLPQTKNTPLRVKVLNSKCKESKSTDKHKK